MRLRKPVVHLHQRAELRVGQPPPFGRVVAHRLVQGVPVPALHAGLVCKPAQRIPQRRVNPRAAHARSAHPRHRPCAADHPSCPAPPAPGTRRRPGSTRCRRPGRRSPHRSPPPAQPASHTRRERPGHHRHTRIRTSPTPQCAAADQAHLTIPKPECAVCGYGSAMGELPTGTVTLLFSDIEGSTALLKQLGDGWPNVLHRQRGLLREAVAAGDGVVVDCQGDALFAAFRSAPAASRRRSSRSGNTRWRSGPTAPPSASACHCTPASPRSRRTAGTPASTWCAPPGCARQGTAARC